ncbi:bacillithiol biosynthesis BshC, partial [candidate division KSB1 bacterium]|nr:bacillithiol biosynthesis BshC [candidate division KSB1 bacterium]
QLSVRNDRPAVCVLEDGRHSLQRGADGYQNLYSKASYSLSELVARPHMLSPKAALRPIVQDTLLPTVAYVAGPGEISYWAQLKGVYTAYDRPMPVVVPRASFLLVEPKIQRHLERYKIDLTRFLSDPQAEIQVLFKEWIPGDISQGLSVLRQEIDRIWPGLRGEALRLDPTLESVVDKSRDQMVKSLHQLEQRLAQAISARRESSGRQLSAAAEHLVPEGQPQERQLNCVPFLVKFGPSLFEKIGRQLDLLNPAVQVIHLG